MTVRRLNSTTSSVVATRSVSSRSSPRELSSMSSRTTCSTLVWRAATVGLPSSRECPPLTIFTSLSKNFSRRSWPPGSRRRRSSLGCPECAGTRPAVFRETIRISKPSRHELIAALADESVSVSASPDEVSDRGELGFFARYVVVEPTGSSRPDSSSPCTACRSGRVHE